MIILIAIAPLSFISPRQVSLLQWYQFSSRLIVRIENKHNCHVSVYVLTSLFYFAVIANLITAHRDEWKKHTHTIQWMANVRALSLTRPRLLQNHCNDHKFPREAQDRSIESRLSRSHNLSLLWILIFHAARKADLFRFSQEYSKCLLNWIQVSKTKFARISPINIVYTIHLSGNLPPNINKFATPILAIVRYHMANAQHCLTVTVL